MSLAESLKKEIADEAAPMELVVVAAENDGQVMNGVASHHLAVAPPPAELSATE